MSKPKFLGSPTHPTVSRIEDENFVRQGTSRERWTIPGAIFIKSNLLYYLLEERSAHLLYINVRYLPLAINVDLPGLRPRQNLRRLDRRHTPLLPRELLPPLLELEQQRLH